MYRTASRLTSPAGATLYSVGMADRNMSPLDRLIGEIDKAIKVLAAPASSYRAPPQTSGGDLELNDADRRESARLMRVNHSGEVAAQALYRGQALTARNAAVAHSLCQAAAEEMDHLAWCEQRLRELNVRTSLLNPLWYTGSFALGALAGAIGDAASLGFLAETEKQVEAHLRSHLDRLPAGDHRSRVIVGQMAQDEGRHGAQATVLGAHEMPLALRWAMRLVSRIMTGSSYWL